MSSGVTSPSPDWKGPGSMKRTRSQSSTICKSAAETRPSQSARVVILKMMRLLEYGDAMNIQTGVVFRYSV